MTYRDTRELKKIDRKDRSITKNIRKTVWVEGRYCDKCFYSLQDEEIEHVNCVLASKDPKRKVDPNMMSILKARKKSRKS